MELGEYQHRRGEPMNFSILDWLILAAYIALIFWVGVRGKRYVTDSSDFLVAGRTMGLYVGMISLVATEIGIITYMYYSEMGVLYGFTACLAQHNDYVHYPAQ